MDLDQKIQAARQLLNVRSRALWPTQFHTADYYDADKDRQQLIQLSYRLQELELSWKVAERAKHGLFESSPDFLEYPEAKGLKEFIGAAAAAIFRRDIHIVESWVHITNGGGFHDAHAHPDFMRGTCGIYYIQAGDCSSDPPNGLNRFYAPDVFMTDDVADFEPVDGRLLLFPGNVRHAALPYRGQRDRIVMAFNALFV